MEDVKTTNLLNLKQPKCVCPKHGEVRSEYVFRVNLPEFGYDNLSFCLVCATEYLSMIAQEIQYVAEEENKTEETKQ